MCTTNAGVNRNLEPTLLKGSLVFTFHLEPLTPRFDPHSQPTAKNKVKIHYVSWLPSVKIHRLSQKIRSGFTSLLFAVRSGFTSLLSPLGQDSPLVNVVFTRTDRRICRTIFQRICVANYSICGLYAALVKNSAISGLAHYKNPRDRSIPNT